MKDELLSELKENRNHGDIDFPLKVYYTILGKMAEDLYLHWHKEMEFILIKSGEGLFYTNLTPISVKEGDILIIPPFSLHSGKPLNGFCECKTIVFNLDIMKNSSADTISQKYLNPIIDKKYRFPLVISKDNLYYSAILESFLKISDSFENRDWGYELEIKAALFTIFSIMFNKKIIEVVDTTNDIEIKSEKIKSVIKYVGKNYKSNITITEVANYLDYSENHFCRFFKSQTGTTFIEYLNSFRLGIASNLLFMTDMPITKVSMESGYDNLSYFIRIFKKRYQCTPFQYRKLNRQK